MVLPIVSCSVLPVKKDRDDYLVHPAHKAFTTLLPDILDKVTVVDYWVQQ